VKLPVIAKKIPVPQNIFPVNLAGIAGEVAAAQQFLGRELALARQKSKIPCKIPC
jgi:hypothetical protein